MTTCVMVATENKWRVNYSLDEVHTLKFVCRSCLVLGGALVINEPGMGLLDEVRGVRIPDDIFGFSISKSTLKMIKISWLGSV